ncbi:MAG: TRAP transporter large permease subunit, partial [Acidobacteria bacterium]|nr:TRAP transporter large permease subunit [Acidobacteriota bacterium]
MAAALAGLLILLAVRPPVSPADMVAPALIGLLAATSLGAPVFATLGGAALILFWGADLPIASIPLDHYRLVINPSLPTIPLFTLAGYFLAEGGASRRLVRVFQALLGRFRGGPAIVTALVCAFFTSFTGASGVTILALGGLLMPVLLSAGYSPKSSLGLLTGAGSVGLLFPPCLPLILYAIVAKISIEDMFLGGIVPGILMVALTAWWGMTQGPKVTGEGRSFDRREAKQAMWDAKWELLLPAVAFAGLFGGIATPVEAAALTALYAWVVETFIYGDLKVTRDAARVMTECGLLVGGVLLILGVALGFTNYLVDAQIAERAVEWVTGSIQSRWVFLLLLNLFLLVVGCLMDIFSAIVVVVPLIVPMGLAFGVDPIHLGIIFLANLELGYLTPPVGMNLFLASYRFSKPLAEVARSIIPILLVLLVGVLCITYVP